MVLSPWSGFLRDQECVWFVLQQGEGPSQDGSDGVCPVAQPGVTGSLTRSFLTSSAPHNVLPLEQTDSPKPQRKPNCVQTTHGNVPCLYNQSPRGVWGVRNPLGRRISRIGWWDGDRWHGIQNNLCHSISNRGAMLAAFFLSLWGDNNGLLAVTPCRERERGKGEREKEVKRKNEQDTQFWICYS